MTQRLVDGPFRELAIFGIGFLAIISSFSAHADFRKALDAYIARDGATMLKEVEDSVAIKSDDGLMLFLNAMQIDEQTSIKASLKDNFKEKIDRSKMLTTFETILTETQQQKVKKLLYTATQYSTPDVQYRIKLIRSLSSSAKKQQPESLAREEEYLASKNSFAAARLAEKYSYSASNAYKLNYSKEKEEYWINKAAELGDTNYALLLALGYLNYPLSGFSPTQEECQSPDNHLLCLKKDEQKGFYWLRQTIRNSNASFLNVRQVAYQVGNVLLTKFDTQIPDYHQAYLWYLYGLNSPDFGDLYGTRSQGISNNLFIDALDAMYKSGELKAASPKLYTVWMDKVKRNEFLFPKNLQEIPSWLIEINNQDRYKKPVFSYLLMEHSYYKLDVYADGAVWLQLHSQVFPDKYMQVSSSQVQQFIQKLQKLGFEDWQLTNTNKVDASYWCDSWHSCSSIDNSITLHNKTKDKIVYLGYDKNLPPKYNDSQLVMKIAKVFALVEEYFPTQKLRCNLGNSKPYKQDCIQYDQTMIDLAKFGE
nr:hypothetical protein [uncultured Methylotenera sp.]